MARCAATRWGSGSELAGSGAAGVGCRRGVARASSAFAACELSAATLSAVEACALRARATPLDLRRAAPRTPQHGIGDASDCGQVGRAQAA